MNSDFTFSGTFGKKGGGKGQFKSPLGIACDNTGKVYVTDCKKHCVQVFTTEGEFLRMFGKHGPIRGELDGPNFITIDTSGMVFIGESGNQCISVFTSEGDFVTSFGKGLGCLLGSQ